MHSINVAGLFHLKCMRQGSMSILRCDLECEWTWATLEACQLWYQINSISSDPQASSVSNIASRHSPVAPDQ